ncbi:MAG TPA: HAMP domain-containing sensor histidine kinase [Phnomibacter sp.]|nr:HAMP domain-containing sensor histidine kinase [Phnomibacter sp.]
MRIKPIHNIIFNNLLWLLAACWIYSLSVIVENIWVKYDDYETLAEDYQEALIQREKAFYQFLEDERPLIQKFVTGTHKLADVQQLESRPFFFFLYDKTVKGGHPFFWSTSQVEPPDWMAQFAETGALLKYGNGYYEVLRKTIQVNKSNVEVVGLVQLYRQYFIDNARLHKGFPGFKNLENRLMFSATPTAYPILNISNEPLFYFQPVVDQPIHFFSLSSFAVQLIATIMLILLVSRISSAVISAGHPLGGFLIFMVGFVGLWLCIRNLGIPFSMERFEWLEQRDSISLTPSKLLQLLQNSMFAFWLGIFLTLRAQQVGALLTGLNYRLKALIALLLVAATIAIHFAVIERLCQLYLSSAVAFDFNNFFSLDYTTVIAFVVLFLILLAHLMLTRFFARSLLFITAGNIRFVMLVVLAGGLFTLSVGWFLHFKIQLLFSMVWLLGLIWFICRYPKPALPVSSVRIVSWLFVYSLSVGLLLSNLSAERLRTRLREISKTLLLQNDQTTDYLVRFASGGLRRLDWGNIIATCKESPKSNAIRDSIANKYFSGYLDRFETKLYFFDENRQPINNPNVETFESLNTLYQENKKEDGYPWVASFEEDFDKFGYIMHFVVTNEESTANAAYVFVVTRSVGLRNALLAPELFRQIQDFAVDLPPGFSYAWYKNERLIDQYRNYPFPSVLPKNVNNLQSELLLEKDDAYEIWVYVGGHSKLVVAGQRNVLIGLVSLVAYLFGSFLILFIVLRTIGGLMQNRVFYVAIFRPIMLTIQAQIRITIVSILAISFIIVAYTTISFFINQYRKSNEERLAKSAEAVSAELAQNLPGDLLNYDPAGRYNTVGPELQDISKNLDVDISFFDSAGVLIASTQNVLFLKEVISERMNPEVYYQLTSGQVHRQLEVETIGNLTYNSIYQPVRNESGALVGYLQIPYFATQNELQQEISNFVVILLNIIAFVFLISGGLALLISGSITRSFAIIADRMNQIRLSEKNERIEWSSRNEIGTLVEQYNRMVDQLESSAARLAQNERELAWREMARQVAHEIKNPLTPMKLSLQFLQKSIQENHPDVGKISDRVAANLVSQIDHLSKIAFEFSQFANIGNSKAEEFDLHSVLRDLVLLYETQENLTLHWEKISEPIMVYADKTQMNRLFTNLLQNAAESVENDDQVQVKVIESIRGNRVLIEVSDTGPGIPTDIQARIFMPNFTTKTSGTGLGLAICKAIVEKAGGNIWFKTATGEGTSFFVEFPLVG